MADTDRASIEQAVIEVVLSREGKRRYSNGDPLTLDPSDLRDIVRLTVAKCVEPSPGTAPVKDHVVREVVNRLRDTALEFHAHGSLRERLARQLDPLLVASRPAEVDPAGLLREALVVAVKLRTDIDKALERIGGAR